MENVTVAPASPVFRIPDPHASEEVFRGRISLAGVESLDVDEQSAMETEGSPEGWEVQALLAGSEEGGLEYRSLEFLDL